MIPPQSQRQYHFVKVLPAEPSILKTNGLIFQHKFDGSSIEVFIEDTGPKIIGKGILEGKMSDFTSRFPEVVNELKRLSLPSGTAFLPEIIVINDKTGMEECSLIQRRTGRDSNISLFSHLYPAKLIIHDVFSVAGIDVSQGTYFDRMDRLKPLIEGRSNSILMIGNSADGIAEWESVIKRKMEGLIARDPKAPLGQKVFKLKRFFTEDVYCKGEWEPSDSSLANIEYDIGGIRYKGLFANIACYQRTKEGKEVKVCDLGGGFKGPERIQIQKMLTSKSITKDNPLVIEVQAFMRYPNMKLRHATFVRIRNDKPWMQCTVMEEP